MYGDAQCIPQVRLDASGGTVVVARGWGNAKYPKRPNCVGVRASALGDRMLVVGCVPLLAPLLAGGILRRVQKRGPAGNRQSSQGTPKHKCIDAGKQPAGQEKICSQAR